MIWVLIRTCGGALIRGEASGRLWWLSKGVHHHACVRHRVVARMLAEAPVFVSRILHYHQNFPNLRRHLRHRHIPRPRCSCGTHNQSIQPRTRYRTTTRRRTQTSISPIATDRTTSDSTQIDASTAVALTMGIRNADTVAMSRESAFSGRPPGPGRSSRSPMEPRETHSGV